MSDLNGQREKAGTPLSHEQLMQVLLSSLFVTYEPDQLDRIMDRTFGGRVDDQLLVTIVTLSNSLSHALERLRRRRGMPAIKLRCTTCSAHASGKKSS